MLKGEVGMLDIKKLEEGDDLQGHKSIFRESDLSRENVH